MELYWNNLFGGSESLMLLYPMINKTTHKECPDCMLGHVFEYEGAEPEPCPNCTNGFIELTEDELLEIENDKKVYELHRLNARLTRRI